MSSGTPAAPDDHTRPEPAADAGVAELQDDIERTRAELGHTVAALADKVDVKARIAHRADETKDAAARTARDVTSQVNRHRGLVVGALVGTLAVAGVALVLRRRG